MPVFGSGILLSSGSNPMTEGSSYANLHVTLINTAADHYAPAAVELF